MSDVRSSPSSGEPAPADTGAPAPEVVGTDVPAAPSSGADGSGASSASDPVSDREGLLAVVQSAVKSKEAAETPPAAEGKAKDADSTSAAKSADADATEPETEPTEAELAAYKPHTRKFIGKLTRQRNDARDALNNVQPELTAHRELVGYLDKHQLAAEDVNLLLGVGAALRRGDFKAFLDGIEPYAEVARQSLGLSISPDLRPKVDEGAMTEDAARELTRTRMDAVRARTEAQTQTQRHDERDNVAAMNGLRDAVDGWEQEKRSRDPDYALKETLIRRTSQAMLRETGTPKSAQEAVQMAQRAYDEVTTQFARARPAVQATRPTPSGISTPSLGAAAVPKTLMEAAMQGLARTQRS